MRLPAVLFSGAIRFWVHGDPVMKLFLAFLILSGLITLGAVALAQAPAF